MSLSIIIVNWNTRDLLAECLRSVFATVRNFDLEVIVVDNASTDNSVDLVRKLFPQVELIQNSGNLGFARGNNVALAHATGECLLLLNPDTILLEYAITRLYEALQACPALGAVGAQLLNPDGSAQMSWGCFPSLWTELPLLNRLRHAAPQPLGDASKRIDPSILSVDWVSGAALMMRRETLEQVGPLDEDYWLYTEETDWCYRARAAGWEIAWVPEAQVVHIARAASRQKPGGTLIHFYRSRLTFLSKHRGIVQALTARVAVGCRAVFWSVWPSRSPLAVAEPDIPLTTIRRAYAGLAKWCWSLQD